MPDKLLLFAAKFANVQAILAASYRNIRAAVAVIERVFFFRPYNRLA
jgi:hypothetical protein